MSFEIPVLMDSIDWREFEHPPHSYRFDLAIENQMIAEIKSFRINQMGKYLRNI